LKKIRGREVIQHLARTFPRAHWKIFSEVLDKFFPHPTLRVDLSRKRER
jgi:hypothetical protein